MSIGLLIFGIVLFFLMIYVPYAFKTGSLVPRVWKFIYKFALTILGLGITYVLVDLAYSLLR
jgi:hypothetical protein